MSNKKLTKEETLEKERKKFAWAFDPCKVAKATEREKKFTCDKRYSKKYQGDYGFGLCLSSPIIEELKPERGVKTGEFSKNWSESSPIIGVGFNLQGDYDKQSNRESYVSN